MMKKPIGFAPEELEKETAVTEAAAVIPKPSVVQVYFPGQGRKLAYYNDQFLLERGDLVYVDGKLEGLKGYVTEVNYNFKIRLDDYKRVVGKADTYVRGTLRMAGSHYITFEPTILRREQVRTWFRAPETGEYVLGSDESSFPLDTLDGLEIAPQITQRGREYYAENRVRYLSLQGIDGYAIVEGGKAYEVTFTYSEGEISRLSCDCFCSYNCKHEFAVLLQLKETLCEIEEHYGDTYKETDCFAVVDRLSFQRMVLDSQKTGTITLKD